MSLEMGDSGPTYDLWRTSYETMEEKLSKAKIELKNDFRRILES
jgi:hypothetical protein